MFSPFRLLQCGLYIGVLTALLAIFLVAEESVAPLSRLSLNLASLSDWKTRVYSFESRREPELTGRLSLTTRIQDGDVVLEDEWNLSGQVRILTKVRCRIDNYLSPIRAEIAVLGRGPSLPDLKPQTAVMDFEDDRVTIESNGKVTVMAGRFREALTNNAFYRIVTLLPASKGTAVCFTWFDLEGAYVQTEHRLECLGEDVVVIDGRPLTAVKFAHTGRNISPQYAWVQQGQLLQVLTDGSKRLQLKRKEQSSSEAAPEHKGRDRRYWPGAAFTVRAFSARETAGVPY